MAFVVGTMLSPAAGFLERLTFPLIVTAVGAAGAFIVGLISSPLMEWTTNRNALRSATEFALAADPVGISASEARRVRRIREHGLKAGAQAPAPVEHGSLPSFSDPNSGRRLLHSINAEEIRPR